MQPAGHNSLQIIQVYWLIDIFNEEYQLNLIAVYFSNNRIDCYTK